MATKTINVDVLAKMFLAGAQNSIKQTGYERSCKGDFFRISAWCKR